VKQKSGENVVGVPVSRIWMNAQLTSVRTSPPNPLSAGAARGFVFVRFGSDVEL
jgi:hypothetical protein